MVAWSTSQHECNYEVCKKLGPNLNAHPLRYISLETEWYSTILEFEQDDFVLLT